MKCFYHSADLDGHCSGAVVKFFNPECELIGINYGQDFPWDKITKDELVYMVDFSLQPFEGMIRLKEYCNLIWIDHHSSAIEDARKADFSAHGVLANGLGACALTWEYFASRVVDLKEPLHLPRAIKLLAEYDVWNHSDPMALPFQYGMRLKETFPDKAMELWAYLFTSGPDSCDSIATAGSIVLEYEEKTNTKFCSSYAFETTILGQPNGPIKIICVNKGFTNSKVFDSIWNPEKYHMMVTFCRLPLPKQQWTVSLYSDRTDVDCGVIAQTFGGGGHKGAAGFQCDDLPFKI